MAIQTPAGRFQWNDEEKAWVSEPVSVPLLNGAKVIIKVAHGVATDKNAPSTVQINALQRFLALPKSKNSEILPHLWRYYQDVLERGELPYTPVITKQDTIWQHVDPIAIYVDVLEDKDVFVSVEANCEWEVEHGLQIVLQNGDRLVRVSDIDGHLTDGHAWGLDSLDDWMSDLSKPLPVRSLQDFLNAKRVR